jgi:hypothetical protein
MQTFSFTNLVPGPSSVNWFVDGNPVQSGGASYQLDVASLASGMHTVQVQVTDLTAFVRNDPQNRLTSTKSWNVSVTSSNPGSYTTFGPACLGSAFPLPPTLSATGLPEIGTTFTIRLSLAKQSSTGALAFGASNTQWGALELPYRLSLFGAPQCWINVSLDLLLPLTTDSFGQASVPLLLPNDPGLIGARFHNQALVLDQAANPFGYSFTNGATAVLGQ